MSEFAGSLTKHPARAALGWYLGVILVGTFVLWLSICHGRPDEAPISLLDATFTATSAVCVTGLAVRSTGADFSLWGQLAILVLIQLGGIGIMTVTTYIMFGIGGRADLRQRMIIAETLGGDPRSDLKWVVRNVLLLTLVFEAAGFAILAGRFLLEMPVGKALWQALFHSISAFCNAGFSLNDDSLERYQGDPIVNGTIMLLVVTGGIGFPVMLDLARNRHGPWSDRWDRLHLHSKLMLIGTLSLLVLATIAFLLLEWNNAMADAPLWQRPMMAAFQSVTCRTAGFNTMPIGTLTNASLFVTILLMMIGAGPCSTGGGFKVSTVMILVTYAWSAFHGEGKVNVFRRTIPMSAVQRAVATAMLFAVLAVVALLAMLFVEQSTLPHPQSQGLFLDAMFEVFSALGTVGLSTGMTSHLSAAGRFIIIVLMFAGRLGPISVFVALSRSAGRSKLEFPEEEPLIG